MPYIYKAIAVIGSYFISNSTCSSATCGILALGNQQLPKRKMPNLLIILQINDFVLLSFSQVYFSLVSVPAFVYPVIVGDCPDMLQHNIYRTVQ